MSAINQQPALDEHTVLLKGVEGVEGKKSEAFETVQAGVEGTQAVRRMVNLNDAIQEYKEVMENAVRNKDGSVTQQATSQARGHVLESHHKATYNINARAKGRSPESTKAHVSGDKLSDGTTHSPQDPVNDVIIETKKTLREQFEKDAPTKKGYQSKAYRNAKETQKQLDKYEDTNHLGPSDQVDTNTISERIGKETISSDPLTNDELVALTEDAKKGEVEYPPEEAAKRRSELRVLNFRSAVTKGAVIGAAATAITEIVDLVRNDRYRTPEELAESLQRIIAGGIDGGARSGVIYLSTELFKTTGSAATTSVLAGANIVYDLAKDLYRLKIGKIDADDLLVNTVTNAFTSVATFTGMHVGTAVGGIAANTTIGQAIGLGATIGSAAGPLGTIIGGTVVGLVTAIGSGLIVSDAQKTAHNRVRRDIEALTGAANLDPSFVQLRLIESMGELAPREAFTWKNLIPMHSIIGDLEEYRQRKRVIKDTRAQIATLGSEVEERFYRAKADLIAAHEARCATLLKNFEAERLRLSDHAFQDFHDSVANEFGVYRRAFLHAFGNLQIECDRLLAQQEAHVAALRAEDEKRNSRAYLLDLLKDLHSPGENPMVNSLVQRFLMDLNSDRWLAGLNYTEKQDILMAIQRGGMAR